ncbi:AvrBs1/Avra family type III secretion system effector [Mycoavidus sp. B2-EB]|uniref:AvrBs1/Avra family type III secretion system effector n=1 Tax=Mycoavidus sp. B2-EB TaxID=2651972 RepID=UPI001627080E|nr:AvrBs1/Avra family type III secretion system effector [Mycoavidus sp. B2-EB]
MTKKRKRGGLLDSLRNPGTSPRVLDCITQEHLSTLNRVHKKKREVQKVAASYEKLRNGATIDSALPGSEHFLFERNSTIEDSFVGGKPAFVRTLRYASDKKTVGGKTPAKRELDTLMNNVPGLDIVATPSTFIGAQFKANIISRAEQLDRPKWKGLPSAVFMPATPDASVGQHTLQATGMRRPGFGDIYSFESSRAFDDNYLKVAPGLSHAEKFRILEKNSEQFIKPDPKRSREGFSHSAQELSNDLTDRQGADPSQAMRHNEFFAKLEFWDMKAVEIGDAKDVAIATLIEFNVEMALLERSLSSEGTHGPTLTDHLQRQISWPADPSKDLLDLSGVERQLSSLDEHESKAYLDGVLGQLRDRVTLCTYQHNGAGSALRTLAFSDFSKEEILAGIKQYLDARLLHVSN